LAVLKPVIVHSLFRLRRI